MVRTVSILAVFAFLAGCSRKAADDGRVTLKSSDSMVSLHSGANLPSWIPVYGASKPEGFFSSDLREETRHTYSFTSADPPAKIAAFYQAQLQNNGFTVKPMDRPDAGGILSAETKNRKRTVVLTIVPAGQITKGSVMAIEKK